MRKIQAQEMEKLAAATGVPVCHIANLQALGVLDQDAVSSRLMRYDYRRFKTPGVTEPQAVQAVAIAWGVSKARARAALRFSVSETRACERCGEPSPPSMLRQNGGICDKCVARTLAGAW